MPLWILISLVAMAGYAARVIVVKRTCQHIDSRQVVLTGRIVGSLVLLPMLLVRQGGLPTDPTFWAITLATAFITAFGSIMMTEAIKKGPLALVIPMQAAVPVFSLLTLWAMFHESPSTQAVVWMLISMSAVAWMLYANYRGEDAAHKQTLYASLSLIAAVLFGFSTILDRIPISRVADGALTYSACWYLLSAALIFTECLRKQRSIRKLVPQKDAILGLSLFSLTMLIAFTAQQYAVQLSLDIPGAIVNVKSIVTLHLPVVVLIGLIFFHEKIGKQALVAGIIAVISALALLRVML